MRQLQLQVAAERADAVLRLAREHGSRAPVRVAATGAEGEERALLVLDLPNERVGAFLWAVGDGVEDAAVTLSPQGVLVLETPFTEVDRSVQRVTRLSTLELVLSSLQSVGSWRGMLLYALFSGVVAAYAVLFNVPWILVAAMLIAPMGAPAMVSVVGAAIGDWRMVGRGALRFTVAILVLVASAVALGLAYGLAYSTAIMEQVTSLSRWNALLALVAGAAGAQSQVESDRSSLVAGTATGFLVAAALSPTSAVLGMSLVLRRWDYTALMAFQLALQYVAIVLGGWLALRGFGVGPSDASAGRGSGAGRVAMGGAFAALLVVLVAGQVTRGVTFRKADTSYEAVEVVRGAVRSVPDVRLLEASAHFIRRDLSELRGDALLVGLVVEALPGAAPAAAVEARVREAVAGEVRARLSGVVPYVDLMLLPGPDSVAEGSR